jgi:hypothetical protein
MKNKKEKEQFYGVFKIERNCGYFPGRVYIKGAVLKFFVFQNELENVDRSA